MPAIVGNVKIISVGSAGVVQFGDTIQNSPESITKTFAGAGSFNTGDLAHTYNAVSNTNTSDNDVFDSDQMTQPFGNRGIL